MDLPFILSVLEHDFIYFETLLGEINLGFCPLELFTSYNYEHTNFYLRLPRMLHGIGRLQKEIRCVV